MSVPFSQFPGRHERHYRRRLNNPLFPRPIAKVSSEDLLAAQEKDHYELVAFLKELRETVQQAVDLKPNVESEVVLKLKADLDKLYEQSCGLADDQSGNKDAIRQLLAVVTRTVWQGAAGDATAERELEEEDQARTMHFHLLEQVLVADVIHPDSAIAEDELVPTLLSSEAAAVAAVVQLFDEAQNQALLEQAEQLLNRRTNGMAQGLAEGAQARLAQLRQAAGLAEPAPQ